MILEAVHKVQYLRTPLHIMPSLTLANVNVSYYVSSSDFCHVGRGG